MSMCRCARMASLLLRRSRPPRKPEWRWKLSWLQALQRSRSTICARRWIKGLRFAKSFCSAKAAGTVATIGARRRVFFLPDWFLSRLTHGEQRQIVAGGRQPDGARDAAAGTGLARRSDGCERSGRRSAESWRRTSGSTGLRLPHARHGRATTCRKTEEPSRNGEFSYRADGKQG